MKHKAIKIGDYCAFPCQQRQAYSWYSVIALDGRELAPFYSLEELAGVAFQHYLDNISSFNPALRATRATRARKGV